MILLDLLHYWIKNRCYSSTIQNSASDSDTSTNMFLLFHAQQAAADDPLSKLPEDVFVHILFSVS